MGTRKKTLLFFALWLMTSSCGAWWSRQEIRPRDYRLESTECENLKIHQAQLSREEYLQLLACVDARENLSALRSWVEDLPAEDLQVWVNYLNQNWLARPDRLEKLHQVLESLEGVQKSDQAFRGLGLLFQFPDFWKISLDLLHAAPSFAQALVAQGRLRSHAQLFRQVGDVPSVRALRQRLAGQGFSSTLFQSLMQDPKRLEGLVRVLAEGHLSELWHQAVFFGANEKEIIQGIPEIRSVFKTIVPSERPGLMGLSQLFHISNAATPCLGAHQEIPNLMKAALNDWLFPTEVDSMDFFHRASAAKMVFTGAICDYPAELGRLYPQLSNISRYDFIHRLEAIARAFQRQGRLRDLVNLMSGVGPLTPVLRLVDRSGLGASMDLLLGFSVINNEGYELLKPTGLAISHEFQLLISVIQSHGSDVFDRWAAWNWQDWDQALNALELFFRLDSDFVSEIFQELFLNTELRGVLQRSAHHPKFSKAANNIYQLSLSEGHLQKLVSSIVRTMRAFTKGREQRQTTTPLVIGQEWSRSFLRHRLSWQVLGSPSWEESEMKRVSPSPCLVLDHSFNMSQSFRSDYQHQMQLAIACLNQNGSYPGLQESWTILNQSPSLWAWSVERVKNFYVKAPLAAERFSANLIHWMGDVEWRNRLQSHADLLRRFLDVRPHWEKLFKILSDYSGTLRKVENYLAEILSLDQLPLMISSFLDGQRESIREETKLNLGEREALEQRLATWECQISDAQSVEDLLQDFDSNVTSYEWKKRDWNKIQLLNDIEKIARKMLVSRETSELSLPVRILELLQRRSASQLFDFLESRSQLEKVIPYFYPGQDYPRLRMVSILDVLELIIVDATAVSRPFALKVLKELALAWADEDFENIPKEVLQERDIDELQTISQATAKVERILRDAERLVGSVEMPDCSETPLRNPSFNRYKRAVFNLKQLMPLIKQEASNGGLRVIRDLFFALWVSTPPRDRGVMDKDKNNLSLVHDFARVGFLRALSVHLRIRPQGRFVFKDFLHTVVSLAHLPEFKQSLFKISQDRQMGPQLSLFLQEWLTQSGRHEESSAVFESAYLLASLLGRESATTLRSAGLRVSGLMDQGVEPFFLWERRLRFGQGPDEAWFVQWAKGLQQWVLDPSPLLRQGLSQSLRQFFSQQFFGDSQSANEILSMGKAVAGPLRLTLQSIYQPHYSSLLERLWKDLKQDQALQNELRLHLSRTLDEGQMTFLVNWIGANPDGFNQLLKTWIEYVESGRILEFSELIHRTIRDPI